MGFTKSKGPAAKAAETNSTEEQSGKPAFQTALLCYCSQSLDYEPFDAINDIT